MNDRFGDVMLSNLRSRGCSLAGVEACITLDTQVLRYVDDKSPFLVENMKLFLGRLLSFLACTSVDKILFPCKPHA